MIELITTVLAPEAEPRWAADAIRDADIVPVIPRVKELLSATEDGSPS